MALSRGCLNGPNAEYEVPLPEPGEPKRAILQTYTKEHSAEYQSQALIDLARRMAPAIGNMDRIRDITILTSHHTHFVIGTGANDPQKMDPKASRETLDHSIMYIFAVALQDRGWHHERSYAPERAARPDTVALWHKIRTVEDPEWTRRYHSRDPKEKAFGGRVVITFEDGSVLEDEIAFADAHPLGARPFKRENYVSKFRELADGIVTRAEQDRFLDLVMRLPKLTAEELIGLTFTVDPARLGQVASRGIFDQGKIMASRSAGLSGGRDDEQDHTAHSKKIRRVVRHSGRQHGPVYRWAYRKRPALSRIRYS